MAKRNGKTKPSQTRVYGETNADDTYVPPDRQDVTSGIESVDMPTEVVDIRAGTSELKEGEDPDLDSETGLRLRKEEPGGEQDGGRQQQRQETRQEPRQQQRQGRDEDGEGEERGLTRSMRKRIARERAITNRERALREQAEKKLQEERVARQAVDDRVTRIERTQAQIDANGDVKSMQAQIDALKPQIAKAVEDGKTADALDLQIKLGEIQSNLAVLKQDLKYRAMNAEQVTRQEAEARRRAAAGGDTSQQIHPADKQEAIERGNEFKKANRHWWRRAKNAEVRTLSVELDKEILDDISDGTCEFEPYSDEHFEELAFRMHEEYPDIEFCDLEGDPYDFTEREEAENDGGNQRREARVQNNGRRQNGNQGRPPQGRGTGSVRGNRAPDKVEMARRGQVELTQEDFDTMRTFKMDPNNPAHKREFAKQRARTILQEASRGGDR